MKRTGYPLCTAVMLSIVMFEIMDFSADFKKIWPGFNQQTLADTITSSSENEMQMDDLTEFPSEEVISSETEEINNDPAQESNAESPLVFTAVDDDYFSDAVFIGDSRIVGLSEYSGLNATFYASVGMNVYDLFDKKFIPVEGSRSKTDLETALSAQQFQKVYLMVGINELGRDTTEGFLLKYQEVLEHIRQLQPNAIIYIQSIMCVTSVRSDSDAIFNNAHIAERNTAIQTLADGQTVFWLDENEVLTDENGALKQEYSGDDTHLLARYYTIWVDYLKTHAIVLP